MLISQKLKKYIKPKNVVFALLLLKICLTFGQKKVVVIDPGHGGKDTGAIGVNGIKEKNIALNIAKEIIELNKTILDNELDIYLTRYRDTLISLTDRTKLAKALNTDLFISLHLNHSKSSNAKGIEVYVHNSVNRNTKESIGTGLSILNEALEKLGFEKRGVKFANFQVLRDAIISQAVLVEFGFVTNEDEADYFIKAESIRAVALAILLGVYNYFNSEL